MNRGKALAKLDLSTRQHQLLSSYLNKRTVPKHYEQRIRIILLAFDGWSNRKIHQEYSLNVLTVSKWRNRWLSHYADLCAYELEEKTTDALLLSKMLSLLSDEARSGTPSRISLSEKESLVALACKKPEDFGIPLNHWNREALANLAMEMGIVQQISPRYVSEILKKSGNSSSQK
ncbi:helix-turn-helix domain-containing protein [uncultured Microscilla sp.]|uniref:helix-turn-helix domain-containing protein n=1 Tax=uncultured Microscilla sp. TaxID=432653 RepID=UPI002602995C|nr:helix-turn-helix domain-containing protein [uncultured Microscilla sp.]